MLNSLLLAEGAAGSGPQGPGWGTEAGAGGNRAGRCRAPPRGAGWPQNTGPHRLRRGPYRPGSRRRRGCRPPAAPGRHPTGADTGWRKTNRQMAPRFRRSRRGRTGCSGRPRWRGGGPPGPRSATGSYSRWWSLRPGIGRYPGKNGRPGLPAERGAAKWGPGSGRMRGTGGKSKSAAGGDVCSKCLLKHGFYRD